MTPPPVKPTVSPAPTTANESRDKLIASVQRRLQQAIFRITERVRTQERQTLDAFIRHVAPSMANNGDSNFPVTAVRMIHDPDRTPATLFPHILFFHVANAVLTFYDLVHGVPTPELDQRIALLERMGKHGFGQYVIDGNDRIGHRLLHRSELPTPFRG